VPRTCTVCTHDLCHEINVALIHRESYRTISDRHDLSQTALKRHSRDHVPKLLVEAKQAVDVADADDLLGEVRDLQARTLAILEASEETSEHRTALAAIREARANLELLARLLGELDERPQVNILISPEWLELRTAIVVALERYPDARGDVHRALDGVGNGRA
jgi:hypothetical protein